MKNKYLFAAAAMLLAMTAFVSCTDKESNPVDEKPQAAHTLTVSAESASAIPEEGGQLVLKVESNCEWHVTSSASWAAPSKTKGFGNDNVIINVATNNVPSERSAVITVSDCMDYNWDGIIDENDLRAGDIGFRTFDVKQAAAEVKRPVCDIFDWVIDKDGNATDKSTAKLPITFVPGGKMTVQMNDKTGKYDAYFSPVNADGADVAPSKTSVAGYYHAKYEDRPQIVANLADGFSMEVLLCPDFDHAANGSAEVKPFSSMQSGGFGFCFMNASRNNAMGCQMNLTAGGKTGWYRTFDAVAVEQGKWYHSVFVYNHDEQSMKLYMNGKLVDTQSAPGTYTPCAAKAGYFMVGGDQNSNDGATCTAAFKGRVAIARIYGEPIVAEQVELLWKDIK